MPSAITPRASYTADLTNDGHIDVITININTNDISVLLGNGDGTFEPAMFFPAGNGPTAIAEGDFNGDGRIDLAVADSGDANGQGQGVSILLGNGDGTFRRQSSLKLMSTRRRSSPATLRAMACSTWQLLTHSQ